MKPRYSHETILQWRFGDGTPGLCCNGIVEVPHYKPLAIPDWPILNNGEQPSIVRIDVFSRWAVKGTIVILFADIDPKSRGNQALTDSIAAAKAEWHRLRYFDEEDTLDWQRPNKLEFKFTMTRDERSFVTSAVTRVLSMLGSLGVKEDDISAPSILQQTWVHTKERGAKGENIETLGQYMARTNDAFFQIRRRRQSA